MQRLANIRQKYRSERIRVASREESRINRRDTQDTMASIDPDYGSALAAITIEAVCRMAS
jgi:hypothetical protein